MLKLRPPTEILQAVDLAWTETIDEVVAANKQVFSLVIFFWNGTTVRSTGEIAGNPRNIIDTGFLRDSLILMILGATSHRLTWTTDYAAEVHEGIGHKPARRWTHWAIRGIDPAPPEWQNPDALLNVPEYFRERFNAHLDR